MKCLQCNSYDIVANVRAVDQTENGNFDAKLEVCSNPGAFFFNGAESFPIGANVCANCGFVMFSVTPTAAKRMKSVQRNVTLR